MWKGSRMISLPSKSSRGNNWQPMYGGGSEEKTPSSEHPDSQTARLAACWVGLLLYFFSFSYSIFLLYELFTKNYLPRWFGRKGFFFISVFLATRWPGAFWSQFPFVLLCDFSIHRAAAYWVSKNTDGHSMYTRIAEGSRESLRAPPPPFFPYLLLLFSFLFGSVRPSDFWRALFFFRNTAHWHRCWEREEKLPRYADERTEYFGLLEWKAIVLFSSFFPVTTVLLLLYGRMPSRSQDVPSQEIVLWTWGSMQCDVRSASWSMHKQEGKKKSNWTYKGR